MEKKKKKKKKGKKRRKRIETENIGYKLSVTFGTERKNDILKT